MVLGLGLATLVPQHGNAAMIVAPNQRGEAVRPDHRRRPGELAGPALGRAARARSSGSDPDVIQDVYFRIGGAETTPVSATVSLLDNAGNSIIDDVWAWRADHGNAVGWTANTGRTGLVVTGTNVTAYGLFTEHYQKNEVIWSGQGGTDIFFQNELPYDPPSQSAWMASKTQDGYPAFLISPNVKTLPGVRAGQLCRVHPDLGDVVQRRGLPGPRHPRRTVPRPPRRVDRWFGGVTTPSSTAWAAR